MKTLKLPLALLFLGSIALAAEPPPPIITKEATGQAAAVGKDGEQKAYDDAVKQALRSAVEQASGVLVTANSVTLNSQLVRDEVFSRASGYVKKFDVVSKKVEKGLVTVVIKADVGTAELDKDLEAVKAMISRLGHTKLIIVTQEQAIDEKGIATKSEAMSAAITDVFKRDGWEILDEKGGGDLKVAAGVAQGNPNVKDVLKTTDADYVVYGTINFRYHVVDFGGTKIGANGEKEPIIFPVTAEYDLAMFNVRSREQIAKIAGKFSEQQIKQKGVQVLVGYSRTASDFSKLEAPRVISELRNPVIEFFRSRAVNGNLVTLTVSGLPDIGSVEDFSASIKTVKDVTEVKQFGDFDNGKAQYTVTIAGSAMDLAKAIDKSKYKTKVLKVGAVKNNAVEVAIAK